MSGSIWNPSGSIPSTANADNTYLSQRFVATAGQAVFMLTNFQYAIGTGSLEVFVNGVWQAPAINFTETTTASFTLDAGVDAGDVVVGRGLIGGTAAQSAVTSAAVSVAAAAASAASYTAINALLPGILPGGTGGALPTANVVLTVLSTGAQAMTPTTWGQSFTLPDATTLNKGCIICLRLMITQLRFSIAQVLFLDSFLLLVL